MTMNELAQEFNVSVRTIQRDIFELTFIFPIYIKNGRHEGGVYICEDYPLGRRYMSKEEIDLLVKLKCLTEEKLTSEETGLLNNIIKNYSIKIFK